MHVFPCLRIQPPPQHVTYLLVGMMQFQSWWGQPTLDCRYLLLFVATEPGDVDSGGDAWLSGWGICPP